ncbi:Oidioi.mRNA.OKI2018_I69.chr1.g275.t1.cds [Oikopleura dioica]|uniref:Oidioi.mRNA.OKI2018_I69.chr1.g275.t1.cds n=1 Tax=Oikopleura dioica TaxID=34765 RepID=A0ABN7STM3_OIKDI|nr:Oidioi.mRNA.OKI2018_I69.chr1.g275.t1.cds [Oikopleura dioica]
MKIYKMMMVLGQTGSGFQIPPANSPVASTGDYSQYEAGTPMVNLKGARKPFNCGPQIIKVQPGREEILQTPNFPKKINTGMNCVLRLQTLPGHKIILKWYGFVVDGCHEGNKVRIVDGDQQQFHCGDKRPPNYVSSTNEVEIAFSVVDMMRNDRGIIYKFGVEGSLRRGVPMHLQGKQLSSKYDFSTEGTEVQGQMGRPVKAIQAQQPQISQQKPQHSQQQNSQQNNQNQQQQQGQQNFQQKHNLRSPVGVFGEKMIRRPMRQQNLQNNQNDQMMYSITQEIEDTEHRQMKVLTEEESKFAEYRSMILLGLGIVGVLIPLALLIKIVSNKKKNKEHEVSG